ncbi:MAG: hypothetical protein WC310_04145 [Patescibacteria group bacterium]|jgi:hypothetical protein
MIFIKNKKGNTLIISLFVVLVLLAETIFLTNQVITSFQEGRLIDNSFTAWYLAESGAENVLYRTRRKEDFSVPQEVSLDNGQIKFAIKTEQSVTVDILRNDFYQLDFFDIPLDQAVTGISLQTTDSSGASSLEVFSTSWSSAISAGVPATNVFGPYGVSILQEGVDVQLGLQPGLYHRAKLKALFGDVKGLTITAYGYNGEQLDLPTRLIFGTEGYFANSSQRIKVSMPKNPPIYGLFDYVLFSEESIEKE